MVVVVGEWVAWWKRTFPCAHQAECSARGPKASCLTPRPRSPEYASARARARAYNQDGAQSTQRGEGAKGRGCGDAHGALCSLSCAQTCSTVARYCFGAQRQRAEGPKERGQARALNSTAPLTTTTTAPTLILQVPHGSHHRHHNREWSVRATPIVASSDSRSRSHWACRKEVMNKGERVSAGHRAPGWFRLARAPPSPPIHLVLRASLIRTEQRLVNLAALGMLGKQRDGRP